MSNCFGQKKKGKERKNLLLHFCLFPILYTKNSDFLTALNVMLAVEFMPEVVIGVVFTFYEGPDNVLSRNVIMSVYIKCSN